MGIFTEVLRITGAKAALKAAINLLGGGLTDELVDEYAAKLADADLTAANIKSGVNIFGTAGTFTDDADAIEADILATKTAYVAGAKLTGTLTVDTLVDNAVVITAVDENKKITAVDHYGANVLYAQFANFTSGTPYPYSALTTIVFKNSITKIWDYAFRACIALQTISLPATYNAIGSYAFRDCTALQAFEAADTCTVIETYAFAVCTAMTSFIARKITSVAANTFNGCVALTAVQLGSIGSPITAIPSTGFVNCTQVGLTITIYVTPGTQPLAASPWGATNATIVYRSAVDGSVL